METKFLKEIGFTDNEIRVYLELLKSEEALASELAERADVNRTLCYQILKKLAMRGIVGYVIKNNIKYFKASHPGKLLDFLKEKEAKVKTILPELLRLKAPPTKKYSVELFEGKEGLKTILEDILRSRPEEWLDFTSGMTVKVLGELFLNKWHQKRVNARIKTKFLINDTPEGRERAKTLKKYKFSELRFLPKGIKAPIHIYIYVDKVGITSWTEDFPFGILIRNKEINSRFKEFFEWFWRISKKS